MLISMDSRSGPIGRDMGLALSFPIGCTIAHAMEGHSEANESIEAFINTLIDTYLSKMAEAGKSQEELAAILRNIIGWSGCFQYAGFYMMGLQNHFPVDSEEDKGLVKDALGLLGMKFLRLAFHDGEGVNASTALDDVRKAFDSLRGEELTRAKEVFASGKGKMKPRKSSVLRSASKRLSSTDLIYLAAESVRRLSVSDGDSRSKSAAIAEEVAKAEAMK